MGSRKFMDEHNTQKHKTTKKGRHKKRSSRSNTPKHQRMQSNKHRRNPSMQSNKGKGVQRSDSNRTLMQESNTGNNRTVFNRETNIDIAYVLKKMIVHLYDADSAQIHYVPVDVDNKRLKDYVMEGKVAKMEQMSRLKNKINENEENEKQIIAAKESLAQHILPKTEHIQQKEKEKEVKKQQ